MNHKVTVVVSSLFFLFSQTSVLSQSSFNDTTLSNTQIAQQSDSDSSSNSSAPRIRRSAGPRFIELPPDSVFGDRQANKIPLVDTPILLFPDHPDVVDDPGMLGTNVVTPYTRALSKIESLNNSGVDAFLQGKYQEAINYYQQSLSIAKGISIGRAELEKVIVILNNLANAYHALGKYQEAISYYQDLVDYYQTAIFYNREARILNTIKIKNQSFILNNLIKTYSIIANIYYQLDNKQKSIEYFKLAVASAKNRGKPLLTGIALNNIGEVYRSLGDKTAARKYYQQALIIFQENNPELARTTEENIAKLSENNNIANNPSNPSSEEITFFCGSVNGMPTTIANTSKGDIAFISWQNSSFPDFALQEKCETVTTRLEKNYQNGLTYLKTGRKNGQNVICMTSIEGGDCEQVLFTLKPGSNPSEQLQALLNVRTGASEPLSQSSSSQVYINLEEYFDTAAPIQQSEPPTKKENN